MLGGPLGALLGGIAGHAADARLSSPEARMQRKQLAFTIGVIALGAKMAKADGRVTSEEVAAFKEVFRFSPDEMKDVGRIFNLAKEDAAGFEAYARQLHSLFYPQEKRLLEDILDGLFHIAVADQVLHPGELAFLQEVARIFGFSKETFEQIRARHPVGEQGNPYDVLGIGPDATAEEIKARHRQLVKENHPDIMAARGVPEEALLMATRNMAAINSAYDEIRKRRGF